MLLLFVLAVVAAVCVVAAVVVFVEVQRNHDCRACHYRSVAILIVFARLDCVVIVSMTVVIEM